MEKPLEEAVIKMPVKPSLAADIESDLIMREAQIGPVAAVELVAAVEPEIGVQAEAEVVIGAAEEATVEVSEAAKEVTDATSPETAEEPIIEPANKPEATESFIGPANKPEVAEELLIGPEATEEPFIGPPIELSTEAAVQSETPTVTQNEEQTTERLVNTDAHANSLAHLLPANTFAQISPRSYLFPGAEVTLGNMDGAEDSDTDGEYSDDEEEENDENESASANASEIIVPDIESVLSHEVPAASPAPTCGTASPTPSTSQLQSNDPETAENITEIQADDANEDLEPVPIKRPRLNADAEAIF